MFSWNNNITGRLVFIDLDIAEFDGPEIAAMLNNGHVVIVNKAGGFALCTPFERRALKYANSGDSIIWPDGRVFTCKHDLDLV